VKKENDSDPRIEALENAARVYAEAQNQRVDQEIWDRYRDKDQEIWDRYMKSKYSDVVSDGGLDPRNSALDVQIGGGHYKSYAIQPVEFIHKNKIPYIEGCAIKYLCRWREKGGIEDLKKVKHYIDLLIEMESKL
jgi:hypothetical protein